MQRAWVHEPPIGAMGSDFPTEAGVVAASGKSADRLAGSVPFSPNANLLETSRHPGSAGPVAAARNDRGAD